MTLSKDFRTKRQVQQYLAQGFRLRLYAAMAQWAEDGEHKVVGPQKRKGQKIVTLWRGVATVQSGVVVAVK